MSPDPMVVEAIAGGLCCVLAAVLLAAAVWAILRKGWNPIT